MMHRMRALDYKCIVLAYRYVYAYMFGPLRVCAINNNNNNINVMRDCVKGERLIYMRRLLSRRRL